MLQYSFFRILIFVVVLMGLYLSGLRAWPLLLLAAVVSAIISLLLLGRQRERFASKLEHTVESRRARARSLHRSAEEDEDEQLGD